MSSSPHPSDVDGRRASAVVVGGRDIDLRAFALQGTALHGRLTAIFDGHGHPTHDRGITSQAGLYFLGLPCKHTWGSGRFAGVADDAEHLLRRIVAVHRTTAVADGPHRPAGTPSSALPGPFPGARDDDRVAPRTAA